MSDIVKLGPIEAGPTADGGIVIVPVGADQAGVLAPIHAASFEEAWDASALTRLLGAGAARALTAFAGYERRPLGFVLAFVAADEAEILTIAVDPAQRRTGIAARLLRTLRDELVQEGIDRVYLEVAADNTAARGLYRRFGFIETGRRKGYYHRPSGPAVDALTLAVSLETPETLPDPPEPHLR